MLLKSLQVQGFKTFADKLSIHFDQGVTGIVGPNGCGKSNIVDAIRWVLGEQRTRVLRVENMTDVIFNGTKNRKMVSLAEATITFENNRGLLPMEYSTVSITRKLYRSGESEYYLNGVPCRLKDIHHLFLDTGIGTDSYSIIELNMVKDILEDKENARKTMFEEAAGVAKYKVRRKETLKKLSDTEQDLIRVEDILAEIEQNMKQLERQAAKTKQYYEQKERYKELSIRLALHKFIELDLKLAEILKKQELETDKITSIETEIAQLEAALEQQKLILLEKEQDLLATRKQVSDLRNLILQKENDRKLDQQRLNQLHIDQRRYLLQNDEYKHQIELAQNQLQAAQEDLISYNIQLEQIEQELVNQQQVSIQLKLQVDTAKNQVQYTQQQQETARSQIQDIEKRIEIAKVELKTIDTEISRLETANTEKEEEISSFTEKLIELEQELEFYKNRIQELYRKEDELNTQKTKLEQEIYQKQQVIYQKQRELDAKTSEYHLLKSMIDNLEGFPESVKFLKKNATHLVHCPLLSEIIHVEPPYKAALENVLAQYLNYYIVPNKSFIWQSIQLLQEKEQGKAGFFSLKDLPKNTIINLENIPDAIPAFSVVKTEAVYQDLLYYLLKDVYIVPDEALYYEHIQQSKHVFVTLSGKVIQRTFHVRGGAVSVLEGKRIGREQEVKRLATEIQSLKDEVNFISQQITVLQDKLKQLQHTHYGQEIRTANQEYQHKLNEINRFKTRHEEFLNIIAQNKDRKQALQIQKKSLQEEIQELELALPELKIALDLALDAYQQAQQEYEEIQKQHQDALQQYNNIHIQHLQQKHLIQNKEKDIQNLTTQIQHLEQSIQRNEQTIQEIQVQIELLQNTRVEGEEDLKSLYIERDTLENELNEQERLFFSEKNAILEQEKHIKEKRHQKDIAAKIKSEFQQRIVEIQTQVNNVKERIKIEFDLDIMQEFENMKKAANNILQLPPERYRSIDDDVMKAKIELELQQLKERLSRTTDINHAAMQAYEEVKKRYDFIAQQRDDLIQAKQDLLKTIDEIDETAKNQFLDCFERIRNNFIQVFRSLFSEGDDCDLVLEDPMFPLESKINIIAKP
ncbi:MAG: chromosome segregation protein SMC, partial [Bacteroidia bacterium]|nr:chromosome segregation protein SMC [Bacteroidia bacterium]